MGVVAGGFLGAIAGLFFGIVLACFGMTMWLWLVMPVVGAAAGLAVAWRLPAWGERAGGSA